MWLSKWLPLWIFEATAPGYIWIAIFVLSVVTLLAIFGMVGGFSRPIRPGELVVYQLNLAYYYAMYATVYFGLIEVLR